MQKITKAERVIPYELRTHARARGVRISVGSGGRVLVSKSRWVSIRRADEVLQKNFEWIWERVEEAKKKPQKILEKYSASDFREHKGAAQKLAEERVSHFNKFFGYTIEKISVKNQRTRWGSCSSRKSLSFNYKIIFLPPELQDYLVVHELCHLAQMNHSHNFWNLVATQIPDYKERRAKLKAF